MTKKLQIVIFFGHDCKKKSILYSDKQTRQSFFGKKNKEAFYEKAKERLYPH